MSSLKVADLSLPCPSGCRKLAKQTQTELANANSVADEVLSSMTTVLAHAAADSAKAAYRAKLLKFYSLQVGAHCLIVLPTKLPAVLLLPFVQPAEGLLLACSV